MRLSWLCEQDPLWIVLILLPAMMLAAEIGCRVGWRWYLESESAKDHFVAIKNALLGILALLLAFSFGMSAQRHETRRLLVIEDATPLRALYLWSSLLPAALDKQFTGLLREYVNLRTSKTLLQRDLSAQDMAQAAARSEAIHRQMWGLVGAMAQQNPPVRGANEMLGLLVDVSRVNSRRVQAFSARVPVPIVWLLLGNAVISAAAIGISAGMNRHRGFLSSTLYSLVVCATIFVVLELDMPGRGVLRPDEGPMLQLKELVNHDREAGR
jgi:hypothetical protein